MKLKHIINRMDKRKNRNSSNGFSRGGNCWLLSFQTVTFFADKSLQYLGGEALGNWFGARDEMHNIFLPKKCKGDRVWSYIYNKNELFVVS